MYHFFAQRGGSRIFVRGSGLVLSLFGIALAVGVETADAQAILCQRKNRQTVFNASTRVQALRLVRGAKCPKSFKAVGIVTTPEDVSRTVDTKINEVIESGLIGAQVGPQGPQGVAGPVGPSGSVGLSAYEVWLSAGNTGTIEEYLVSIRGAEGLQGPAGPQGIQGEIGPMGVAGPQGTSGAQGPQGVPGPQGSEGVTGATGAQGPQGPTGPQGPQGPPGTPASGPQLILPISVLTTGGGLYGGVAGTNNWNRFDIQASHNIPEGAQGAIIEWFMQLEESLDANGTALFFGKTGTETLQAETWMAGAVRSQGTGDQGGGGGQAFVPFDTRGTLAGQFTTTRRLWWRLAGVGSSGFYSSGQNALQNGGMYIRIIGYY